MLLGKQNYKMYGCYVRNSVLPFEEALDVEFKGHRDFSLHTPVQLGIVQMATSV